MNMIVHQAIGPDLEIKALGVFSQKLQICRFVLIIKEDSLTVISALSNMVWISKLRQYERF